MTLVVIGLIMLFSASYASAYYETGSSYTYIIRQGIFAVVGVGAMIFISYFDYHWLHKLKPSSLGVSWLMLGVTLLLPPVANVSR